MERRFSLLPTFTDNFILNENSSNLTYNPSIKILRYDAGLDFINPLNKSTPDVLKERTYISILKLYEAYPEYDYYWMLEDDVLFNGDMSLFFKDSFSLDHDLLYCTGIYRKNVTDISKIPRPQRIPGDQEMWYEIIENKIFNYRISSAVAGGFTGIMRFSKKLISLMLELHNKKVFGHSECYPITIASIHDLKIGFLEEIFKEKNYLSRLFCNFENRYSISDLSNLPKNTFVHAVKF